jgi:hypothetical protein
VVSAVIRVERLIERGGDCARHEAISSSVQSDTSVQQGGQTDTTVADSPHDAYNSYARTIRPLKSLRAVAIGKGYEPAVA